MIFKALTGGCAALTLAVLLATQLPAQTTVTGRVTDARNQEALQGAVVQVKGTETGVYTDEDGRFSVQVSEQRPTLRIRYLGYLELNKTLDLSGPGPHHFDFSLHPNDLQLPTTTITDSRLLRLYPDGSVQVQDFEFMGDNLLLIVYDGKLKRNILQLWDAEMQLLAEYRDTYEPPRRLETDCLGNLQCLSENYAWQVDYTLSQLVLRGDSIRHYRSIVEPCRALLDSTYYFDQEHHRYLKSFIYIRMDEMRKRHLYASMDTIAMLRIADEKDMPRHIVSPELLYGKARPGQAAAFQGGLNGSYLHTIQFPEVYIPIHVVAGTACIFDHTRKKLIRFDSHGQKVGESDITYPDLRRWQRSVIVDHERSRAFTLTEKNGLSKLLRIDLETGEIDRSWDLPLPFVQKIRVRGDHIYFLYRDHHYDPVKRIYRYEM